MRFTEQAVERIAKNRRDLEAQMHDELAALAVAKLPAEVVHTGGGCMAIEVRVDGDTTLDYPYLFVTHRPQGASLYTRQEQEGEPVEGYLVGFYSKANGFTPDFVDEYLDASPTPEALVAACRALVVAAVLRRMR